LADVVSELAAVEPMLSPFNLQRVAAEAVEQARLAAEVVEQARLAAEAAERVRLAAKAAADAAAAEAAE
jgi:hypothetical protein